MKLSALSKTNTIFGVIKGDNLRGLAHIIIIMKMNVVVALCKMITKMIVVNRTICNSFLIEIRFYNAFAWLYVEKRQRNLACNGYWISNILDKFNGKIVLRSSK